MIKKWLYQGDNQYFFRLFEFIRPNMFRYVVTQIIYSGQGFVFPFILAAFTSSIMASIVDRSTAGVVDAGIMLLVLIAGFMAVLCPGLYINMLTIFNAELRLKRRLFNAYTAVGIEDAKHSGEGIASINNDANTAISIFSGALFQFLNNGIQIPAAIIVVLVVEWRLGLALLAVGIISFILQHRFTAPLAEIGKKRLDENAENVKTASNIFSGAVTIRAYNMQPKALLTFDRHNNKIKLLDLRQAMISMWQNTIGTFEGWLTILVTFGLGGYLIYAGIMEFHLIVLVYIMGRTLTASIGGLGRLYADLQPPIAAAKRVFLALESLDGITVCKKSGQDKTPDGYALTLRDFSFRYLNTDKDVLKGIHLEVAENTMVALVGESGSGKSTLLRAIIGMYEREDLGLVLGGVPYNDASIECWRRSFAYVDQSCRLFDLSIKENIAMGLGGKAPDEDIEQAAKTAAAHEFITELENGYDAPCGEKGSTLSGGQKQRIAIARALIKKAPIMVFDEATSSLDKDSERQIMETVENLRQNHTILITTHNLNTIVGADKIIMLKDGEVAETGTHDELMAKRGLYYRLFIKQGDQKAEKSSL